MADVVIGKWLSVAALLFAAPVLDGAAENAATWQGRVLLTHNRERATAGISPLRWNLALAASAQKWVDHLAATGEFRHAPEDAANPEGENIWGGTKGYFSSEAMVGTWIAEKKNFQPGIFPNNSRTGRVEDVGHYTQLMWRDSAEVGCAMARSSAEDLLVCRYSAAGNWAGERPF